jgi:flagellar hook protein FlgE
VSNFALNQLVVTVPGRDADTETAVISVYDSLGSLHSVTFTFTRQIDGKWTLTASVDPTEGTISNPTIASLQFGPLGDLPAALATTLDVTWTGAAAPQSVALDFGTPGSFDGLTQFGSAGDVFGDSDGFPAGSLTSIGVRADGTIEGFYTNGQIQSLAQLQLALFTNPAGLERAGNGLVRLSSNSGAALLATAGTGSAGTVVSGSLEGSNVDVAEEFVRLIEAQRGFQANARIISTTDQVLAELVNLGR